MFEQDPSRKERNEMNLSAPFFPLYRHVAVGATDFFGSWRQRLKPVENFFPS